MSLKVALIAGSSRRHSQSAKVAHYLAGRLRALDLSQAAHVIDLGSAPLPSGPPRTPTACGPTMRRCCGKRTPW